MRLLNVATAKIEHFDSPSDAPPYAAVSYVWPKEATFKWTSTPAMLIRDMSAQQPKPIPSVTSTSSSLSSLLKFGKDKTGTRPSSSDRSPAPPTAAFESKWPIPSCSPESLNKALNAILNEGQYLLDRKHKKANPNELVPAPAFTHLWMDVLCLNQVDDKDKAEDVKHMKDYYSNAVCVWVFLDKLGEPDLPVNHDGPARWFTRLWTLQECILPPKIYFYLPVSHSGKKEDPLSAKWVSRLHLTSYIGICTGLAGNNITHPQHESEAFKWNLQLLALAVTKPSIKVALLLSSVRECRFEVDRLYGIIGMLPKDLSLFDINKLVMDYSKSFAEISESFASALGPELLDGFTMFCPPPAEMKSSNSKMKVSQSLGWFGNFEPGFYIGGSIMNRCGQDELARFISQDKFDVTASLSKAPQLKRPGELTFTYPQISHAKLSGTMSSPGFNGILLSGTFVTHVTNITTMDVNSVFAKVLINSLEFTSTDTMMVEMISTAMSVLDADEKDVKWAADERRRYIGREGKFLNPFLNDEDDDDDDGENESSAASKDSTTNNDGRAGGNSFFSKAKATVTSTALKVGQTMTDSLVVGIERLLVKLNENVNSTFLYPPFMSDLQITTAGGAKIEAYGAHHDDKTSKKRIVMLLVKRSQSIFQQEPGFPDQTDVHILGVVVQEADAARGKTHMVVRKVGVIHAHNYFGSFDHNDASKATATAAAATAATTNEIKDFVKMDVIVI